RLEQQPYAYRQGAPSVEVLQCECRTDERAGVHVVPARVRDAWDLRTPRVGGGVFERQAVHVASQRHGRMPRGADFRDDAAAVEATVLDAALLQHGHNT